jgi:hypothetical protein
MDYFFDDDRGGKNATRPNGDEQSGRQGLLENRVARCLSGWKRIINVYF